MSKYLLDKFLFTVDRDPELVERYRDGSRRHRRVVGGRDGQLDPQLPLRREVDLAGVHRRGARRRSSQQDHVALFELGAHPFLTLTLFIAMFERDHGPLEYQIGLRPGGCKHLDAALPRHRDLTCAPPCCTHPGRRRRTASTRRRPPAAGSTLVRVTAAPVVPLDLLCASGTSYFGVPATPYVPGGQGVGVVESSDSYPAGSRVWFFATAGMKPGDGSAGRALRWCRTPTSSRIEEEVPDELAAALGLSGIAAWMALSWRARLQPGERVLVLGGGGAVGQAGIGAARVLGASTVVAWRGRRRSTARRAAGRRRRRPARGRRRRPDGRVGRARAVRRRARPGLRRRGDRGLAGPAPSAVAWSTSAARRATRRRSPRSVLRSRTASVLGYTNNALSAEQRREAITAVLGHAAAGRIRMQYDVRPLAEVEQVWTRVAAGGAEGRQVLVP